MSSRFYAFAAFVTFFSLTTNCGLEIPEDAEPVPDDQFEPSVAQVSQGKSGADAEVTIEPSSTIESSDHGDGPQDGDPEEIIHVGGSGGSESGFCLSECLVVEPDPSPSVEPSPTPSPEPTPTDPPQIPIAAASSHVVMDFEDSVLHDADWLASQPAGTTATFVKPIAGNGPNALSLAVGEGINGGNALLIEGLDSSMGLPSVYLQRATSTGGSYTNAFGDAGYMLPRGMRANRLEFWMKFQDGFLANSAATSNNIHNMHIGTYHFDPAKGGPAKESDNFHFYHEVFVRHDQARDGWIHVVMNTTPQHQRSVSAAPPREPTQAFGNYWELLTRFYVESTPYFGDPEIGYPYKMWLDDVRLSYVPEPGEISIRIENYLSGQEVAIQNNQTNDFSVTLTNTSDREITGNLMLRAIWSLWPSLLDAPVGGSPVALEQTFAAGETRQFTLRLEPTVIPAGDQYDAGIAFIPDDQLTPSDRSITDPNLENRKYPGSGPHDAIVYGAFLNTVSGPPMPDLPPTAQGGVTFETTTGQGLNGTLPAHDPEGAALTFTLVEQSATGGTFDLVDATTGAFTFMPAAGFTGIYRIKFRVSDGTSTSRDAVAWIAVK